MKPKKKKSKSIKFEITLSCTKPSINLRRTIKFEDRGQFTPIPVFFINV